MYYEFVVAQFIPLLSRQRRDKGGDWASVMLDKSSNYIPGHDHHGRKS